MLASAHLRRLNDCCLLFLQAVTLPNYTSPNNGQRLDHSKLIWKPVILQQQYHKEWKFWQKAYQFLRKWHLESTDESIDACKHCTTKSSLCVIVSPTEVGHTNTQWATKCEDGGNRCFWKPLITLFLPNSTTQPNQLTWNQIMPLDRDSMGRVI